jgi:hypothetical protein
MSGLRFQVFDPTNTTFLGELTTASDGEFVDEYNGPGFGKVKVLLGSTDAGLLLRDRVVRVLYEGSARFSWFVEKLDRTLADRSGQQWLEVSGRGLLAWLEDSVVYPQGGLRETAFEERPFNYASEDGAWKSSVAWSTPVGVTWKDDTSTRAGLPTNWPDKDAQWIWSTDPDDSTVAEGTVNYFRSTFTLDASTRIKFFATADNFFELYLDGTLVMSSDRFTENAPSFAQQTSYTTRLGVGTHTIAARVRNGKPWERDDVSISKDSDEVQISDHGLVDGTRVRLTEISRSGTGLSTGTNYFVRQRTDSTFKLSESQTGGTIINIQENARIDIRLHEDRYAGFLMTALKMNEDGKINRSAAPVRRTNTVAWEVATEEPQHRPAQILWTLITEGQARSVYRFRKFTRSFTNATPSTGVWTTYVDLFLRVGTDLLQIMDAMVDTGVDFWINPSTCQLSAAEPRGTDRSATVRFEIAKNLMAYETSAEPIFKTAALVQTLDGWQQVSVTDADTLGRREMFMEIGRTRSRSTARRLIRQLLAELGKARVTATSLEAVVVEGVVPYVSFDVGDLVSIPAPTGSGFKRARVLSIGMRDENGTARFMPELEVLDD